MTMHSAAWAAPLSLVLFSFSTLLLHAQQCGTHPTDPAATFDTMFVASFSLESSSSSSFDFELSGSAESCHIQSEVCVFRTTAGKIDYVISPSSVQFGPYCDVADSYSTTTLFDLIAKAAVLTAASIGKGPCAGTGSDTVRILAPACDTRSGSGSTTQFVACSGSATAERRAWVACSGGGSTVTMLAKAGGATTCTPPCEVAY